MRMQEPLAVLLLFVSSIVHSEEVFVITEIKPEGTSDVKKKDQTSTILTDLVTDTKLDEGTTIKILSDDVEVYGAYGDQSSFQITNDFVVGTSPEHTSWIFGQLRGLSRVSSMRAKTRGNSEEHGNECNLPAISPSVSEALSSTNQKFVRNHQMSVSWIGSLDSVCWNNKGEQAECESLYCEAFTTIDFDLIPPDKHFAVRLQRGKEVIQSYNFELIDESQLPIPKSLTKAPRATWSDYQKVAWLIWLSQQEDGKYAIIALSFLSEMRNYEIANSVFESMVYGPWGE